MGCEESRCSQPNEACVLASQEGVPLRKKDGWHGDVRKSRNLRGACQQYLSRQQELVQGEGPFLKSLTCPWL